jgi:hypothetical protein
MRQYLTTVSDEPLLIRYEYCECDKDAVHKHLLTAAERKVCNLITTLSDGNNEELVFDVEYKKACVAQR